MRYLKTYCLLWLVIGSLNLVFGQNQDKRLKGLIRTYQTGVQNYDHPDQKYYDSNMNAIPEEWINVLINAPFKLKELERYPMDYYVDQEGSLRVGIYTTISNIKKEYEIIKERLFKYYENPTDEVEKSFRSLYLNQSLPPFSFPDLDQEVFTTEKLKGKVVVINFWFIKCGPCIAEIPSLNNLVSNFKKRKDVEFLAFSGMDSEDEIREFINQTPFNYRHIPKAGNYAGQLNISNYPSHIILDRMGKVHFFSVGYTPNYVLEKKIKEALKQKRS